MGIDFSVWIKNVRLIVNALSDAHFQNLAWSGSLETSFNSPDEMISFYFDDALVPEFIRINEKFLSCSTIEAGEKLSELLDNYDWPMKLGFIDHEVLLNQYEWKKVQFSARIFLGYLNQY